MKERVATVWYMGGWPTVKDSEVVVNRAIEEVVMANRSVYRGLHIVKAKGYWRNNKETWLWQTVKHKRWWLTVVCENTLYAI